MFGGAGLYRDGVIFGLVTDSGIYLKCDAEIEPRFRAAGSHPFVDGRDTKSITMSYWSLPNEALDDSDALKEWAELAFGAALRKSASKKKSGRRVRPDASPETGPSPGPRRGGSAQAPRSGTRKASRPGK